MQKFIHQFDDVTYTKESCATIQSCIRVNDLDEVGDGTHLLYFNMLGLFSFRDLTLQEGIDFWMKFLDTLGLYPDFVTIHPDKMDEWKQLYSAHPNMEIRKDPECMWSDGTHDSAYCTEFYIIKDGVDIEIGNIVNPCGDCIDAGFGLERLDALVNQHSYKNVEELYVEAIRRIIDSGYLPGNLKQGYVLRKLLRNLHKMNFVIHEDSVVYPFYVDEISRQEKLQKKYDTMITQTKYQTMPKEEWYSTYGIDLDTINTTDASVAQT